MDCPQCGGRLATYALGGDEAVICEDCGYVGIEADHHGTPVEIESWTDALRRFYDQHATPDEIPHADRSSGERPSDSQSDTPSGVETDGGA